MIIVSGRIYILAEKRDEFLSHSDIAMHKARRAAGCLDFVVAADPLEPDRVNVYEEWDSVEALEAFRGDGPGENLSKLIDRAVVRRHYISRSGDA